MSTTTPEKTEPRAVPRLKTRYREEIVGKLREDFAYPNVMQVPGLVKIVVNMGVGDAAEDSKLIDGAIRDLATARSPRSPRPASRSRSSSCARGCRSAAT
jgi:large subunit ribosomal protein L5